MTLTPAQLSEIEHAVAHGIDHDAVRHRRELLNHIRSKPMNAEAKLLSDEQLAEIQKRAAHERAMYPASTWGWFVTTEKLLSHIAAITQQRDDAQKDAAKWKHSFEAQNSELQRLSHDAEDRDDAIERLAEIGRAIGCDHHGDPDGRSRLVSCVEETIANLEQQITDAKAEAERLRASQLLIARTYDPNCDNFHEGDQVQAMAAARETIEAVQELASDLGRDPEGCLVDVIDDARAAIEAGCVLSQELEAVKAEAKRLKAFEIDNETMITLRQDNRSNRGVTVWASRNGTSQGIARITSGGIRRINDRSESLAIALDLRTDCVQDVGATTEAAELRQQLDASEHRLNEQVRDKARISAEYEQQAQQLRQRAEGADELQRKLDRAYARIGELDWELGQKTIGSDPVEKLAQAERDTKHWKSWARSWRERCEDRDRLAAELATAKCRLDALSADLATSEARCGARERELERVRRACEPMRKFAQVYAQSAWADDEKVSIAKGVSFTCGEARAFVATLPQPAPPSPEPEAPKAEQPTETTRHIIRACLTKEPEGGFTVQALNLRGAISEGETEEEAIANIKEAAVGVAESYRADGEVIPWLTSWEVPEYSKIVCVYIDVAVKPTPNFSSQSQTKADQPQPAFVCPKCGGADFKGRIDGQLMCRDANSVGCMFVGSMAEVTVANSTSKNN